MEPKRAGRRWKALGWRLFGAALTLLLTVWVGWLGAWLPDRSWRPQGGPDGVPVFAGPAEGEEGGQADSGGAIPPDAVRLRIIANSDRPEDQAVKQRVRDEVIREVSRILKGAADGEEARRRLEANLPLFQRTAEAVVREAGYTYPVRTDFGRVPFPTKIYGNRVYPAGDYEALRIVLGSGLGQNWWCVLFPPLCFVDLANGDAVPAFQERGGVTTVNLPGADGRRQQAVLRWMVLDFLFKVLDWVRHKV
ncbi:MAG: stage II sporulation protein R [Alicyclobacillaceae bacterium]|nr:stage II sporulation protein R [Alicyclobacillaceae bacterium]